MIKDIGNPHPLTQSSNCPPNHNFHQLNPTKTKYDHFSNNDNNIQHLQRSKFLRKSDLTNLIDEKNDKNRFLSHLNTINKKVVAEIYPISKGEIHKISEEPSETEVRGQSDASGSQEIRTTATIVNHVVPSTYGARLLTKMGWRFGEGLGKDRDGIVRAVRFQSKLDRRGLAAETERQQTRAARRSETASGQCQGQGLPPDKNPVSILMEFCQKNRLSAPIYTDVEVIGPTNNRQFRLSVTILDKTYLAEDFYKTKKEARAGSASIAARELNLL